MTEKVLEKIKHAQSAAKELEEKAKIKFLKK